MFGFFSKSLRFFLVMYSVLLFIYSIFSYSLTDPNLVLSQWSPYWSFQQWMWQTFFHNSHLLTYTYVFIIVGLFFIYREVIRKLTLSSLEYQKTDKEYLFLYLLLIVPILGAYNALSHDVFNYIFNAKMLLFYHANPHEVVALNYPNDLWLRFMHNTHTTAPYGYGWTFLSVIPFEFGFGKFITTWLAFRFWSLLSIVALYFALQYAAKVFWGRKLQAHELAIVFLNPLFVIEILGNMHNDVWMMAPAIFSIACFTSLSPSKLPQLKQLLLGIVTLCFSISIKWATLVLVPLVVVILLEKNYLLRLARYLAERLPVLKMLSAQLLTKLESQLYRFIPLIASLLLFIPLFTERSQQFLPWYLIWVLVWLPFVEVKFWRNTVLIFSISSLLRYLPWLWTGGFEGNVILWQKLITWLPVLVFILWKLLPLKIYSHSLIPGKDSNLK